MEDLARVNVRDIISTAKPGLEKKIPGFVYRKLNKILHIEEINKILERIDGMSGQEALEEICSYLGMSLNLHGPGLEEMKALEGSPIMFVSNHPFGGPEGIVLFRYIHEHFPDSKMLVQSYLKYAKPLRDCCVFNHKDIQTLKDAVSERKSLLFYPAGFCSRRLSDGQVFDYDWKPTFVKLAKKNNMPIVVFYTDGHMTERMFRWTKFRKIFHIKPTIETIFLPDEMLKRKNTVTDITAGHIIYPEQLDDSVCNVEWAQRIRQYCRELKDDSNAVFDPSLKAELTLV